MEQLRYPMAMRIMHWGMAVVILGLIAAGWYMKELSGKDPLRADLFALHKSFGVVALVLIVLRIALRLSSHIPPLPVTMNKLEQYAAKVGHLLLYAGMIAVPGTGFIMSMAGGRGINFFGTPLPMMMEKNRALAGLAHELHETLPYLLLVVILLHVAGALKHRFMDAPENDVLPRMGF